MQDGGSNILSVLDTPKKTEKRKFAEYLSQVDPIYRSANATPFEVEQNLDDVLSDPSPKRKQKLFADLHINPATKDFYSNVDNSIIEGTMRDIGFGKTNNVETTNGIPVPPQSMRKADVIQSIKSKANPWMYPSIAGVALPKNNIVAKVKPEDQQASNEDQRYQKAKSGILGKVGAGAEPGAPAQMIQPTNGIDLNKNRIFTPPDQTATKDITAVVSPNAPKVPSVPEQLYDVYGKPIVENVERLGKGVYGAGSDIIGKYGGNVPLAMTDPETGGKVWNAALGGAGTLFSAMNVIPATAPVMLPMTLLSPLGEKVGGDIGQMVAGDTGEKIGQEVGSIATGGVAAKVAKIPHAIKLLQFMVGSSLGKNGVEALTNTSLFDNWSKENKQRLIETSGIVGGGAASLFGGKGGTGGNLDATKVRETFQDPDMRAKLDNEVSIATNKPVDEVKPIVDKIVEGTGIEGKTPNFFEKKAARIQEGEGEGLIPMWGKKGEKQPLIAPKEEVITPTKPEKRPFEPIVQRVESPESITARVNPEQVLLQPKKLEEQQIEIDQMLANEREQNKQRVIQTIKEAKSFDIKTKAIAKKLNLSEDEVNSIIDEVANEQIAKKDQKIQEGAILQGDVSKNIEKQKSGAEEFGQKAYNEVQARILQKAIPEEEQVDYTLSSVTDSFKLGDVAKKILRGEITEEEAVANLKSDYEKLKKAPPEEEIVPAEKETKADMIEFTIPTGETKQGRIVGDKRGEYKIENPDGSTYWIGKNSVLNIKRLKSLPGKIESQDVSAQEQSTKPGSEIIPNEQGLKGNLPETPEQQFFPPNILKGDRVHVSADALENMPFAKALADVGFLDESEMGGFEGFTHGTGSKLARVDKNADVNYEILQSEYPELKNVSRSELIDRARNELSKYQGEGLAIPPKEGKAARVNIKSATGLENARKGNRITHQEFIEHFNKLPYEEQMKITGGKEPMTIGDLTKYKRVKINDEWYDIIDEKGEIRLEDGETMVFPKFSDEGKSIPNEGVEEKGIPPTITKKMGAELRDDLGYSQEQINAMTPEEAHRILSGEPVKDVYEKPERPEKFKNIRIENGKPVFLPEEPVPPTQSSTRVEAGSVGVEGDKKLGKSDFDENGDLTDDGFSKATNILSGIINDVADKYNIPKDKLLEHYNIKNGKYRSSLKGILDIGESQDYQKTIKFVKDIAFEMFPDKIDELNNQINSHSDELLNSLENDKPFEVNKSIGKVVLALNETDANWNKNKAVELDNQPGSPVRFDKEFNVLHNPEKSIDMGERFNQRLEPFGKYVIEQDPSGFKPEGWEQSRIKFDNPLVVETDGSPQWKKDLSERYGKTGKDLTKAILNEGYDGIVTVRKNGTTGEIVVFPKGEPVRFEKTPAGEQGVLISEQAKGPQGKLKSDIPAEEQVKGTIFEKEQPPSNQEDAFITKEQANNLLGRIRQNPKQPDILGSFILPNPVPAFKYIGKAGTEFYKQDIAPKLSDVSKNISETATDIKVTFAAPKINEASEFTAMEMKSGLAEMARKKKLAYQALEKVRDVFSRLGKDYNLEFINRMETDKLHPEEVPIATAFRKLLDDRWNELNKRKLLDSYIQDYFPHLYKNPQLAMKAFQQIYSKRPLGGTEFFTKQRKFDTIQEAQDWAKNNNVKLDLVSDNPVDVVLNSLHQMDKLVMKDDLYKSMEAEGMLGKLGPKDRVPVGWKRIEDTRFSNYYAPEPAAKVINNYLSAGIMHKPSIRMIRQVGNFMNQVQLGMSAFHAGFTTNEAIVSTMALGIQKLSQGKFIEAGKEFMRLPVAPLWNVLVGDKVIKQYMSNNPTNARMVKAVIDGGMRIDMDNLYHNSAIGSFKDALLSGNPFGAALRSPGALIEAVAYPTMQWLVPRQKLGAFWDMAKNILSDFDEGKLDEKTTKLRLQEAQASVDNRFGQMVYDNLFWNKTLKDVLMISTRSVGWNYGTFREIGGSVADLVQQGKNLMHGKDVRTTPRMAYSIALPLTIGLEGLLFSYFAGTAINSIKDIFAPKTGNNNPDGTPERIFFPSYMKDVVSYTKQPFTTLWHKLHPEIASIIQMLNNEDYFNTEITDVNLWETIKKGLKGEDAEAVDHVYQWFKDMGEFSAKQFVPFSITNMAKRVEAGGKIEAGVESFVGITPAPKYLDLPKWQETASEMLKSRGEFTSTKDQLEARKLSKKLGDAIKSHLDEGSLGNAIQSAIDNGDISEEEMQDAKDYGIIEHGKIGKSLKDAVFFSPQERMLKRLSLDEVLKVYNEMEPDDQTKYQRLVFNKIVQSKDWDNMDKEERNKFIPILKKIKSNLENK